MVHSLDEPRGSLVRATNVPPLHPVGTRVYADELLPGRQMICHDVKTLRDAQEQPDDLPRKDWASPGSGRPELRQAACALPIARTRPDVEIEPLR
ncbi:hypothetical protein GCM10023198_37490 [Promicromonospora umidemergens]|uniref:Uncharacterized protein n=1 Tax=Promicromonospora umidemergens TaxID=629679 RepID=A0ABP8XND3_9MICO